MTFWKWSQTAASNATADTTVNAREGMAPSQINDAMRAMMAALAKYRDDMSGNLVTGGTATALTITSNQGFTSLTDGIAITARMTVANGASPTLALDGLTAKSIATVYGSEPASGALRKGGVFTFVYDSTDDKFIVHGALGQSSIETGFMAQYVGTTAPAGWVRANGLTIGDASSSATERANADTEALFTLLWSAYSNTTAPIYTSAGAASTRGASAAADYAAHKRLALPDLRGRVFAGLDDMGNSGAGRLGTIITSSTTNGASGGAETHSLTANENGQHQHAPGTLVTDTEPDHTHIYGNAGNSLSVEASNQEAVAGLDPGETGAAGAHSHGISGLTATSGSGASHNNMQPTWLGTILIRL